MLRTMLVFYISAITPQNGPAGLFPLSLDSGGEGDTWARTSEWRTAGVNLGMSLSSDLPCCTKDQFKMV